MSAHTLLQQQASMLTGRQMVLAGTIALHGMVIAALMAMRIMPDATIPEFNAPIDVPPDHRIVEATPQVSVDQQQLRLTVFVPNLPVPDVQIPRDDSTQMVSSPPADPVPAAALDARDTGSSAIPQIPATTLQYHAVRSADEYYPSQSLSLQEEGTAIVRVCVAPSGKIDGKPTIETTSGSARLDAAALAWAREALRFTPATQNGSPVGACKGFRVNFTLH